MIILFVMLEDTYLAKQTNSWKIQIKTIAIWGEVNKTIKSIYFWRYTSVYVIL